MDLAGVDVLWPFNGELDIEVTHLMMSLGWHSLPVNSFHVIYDVGGVKTYYARAVDLAHTLLHNLARCYRHYQCSIIQVLDRELATAREVNLAVRN